jgi:adenylate kinase family enzyme
MEAWLTEILPQADSQLEDFFANGYFLGQLLYSLGLMENFGKIVNSDRYTDKNLAQVAATLELIGIELDVGRLKTRSERYVQSVLATLYDKVQLASSQKVLKNRSPTKPQAGSFDHKKFEQERLRQVEHAIHCHQEQEEAFRLYVAKRRTDHLDTIQANHIFMQQWEAEGKKKWAANQEVKAKRKTHLLNVKTKQATDFKANQLKWIKDHEQEVKQDIRDFENTLVRLGIDHKEGQTVKKKQNLATEAAVTMARIKEHKLKNDLAAKERESRQRAVDVERLKSEKIAKVKEGLSKLAHFYEVLKKHQQSNSYRRLKKYTSARLQYETTLEKFKLAELSKQLKYAELQETQAKELEELQKLKDKPNMIKERAARNISELQDKHELSKTQCTPILQQILDLAEIINTEYEERGGIPEDQWQVFLHRFIKGEQAEGVPSDEDIGADIAESESPSLTCPSSFRGALPIDSYLDAVEEWDFGLNTCNNFYLGDALEVVAEITWPQVTQLSVPAAPHYLPLKLSITGPSFSGKHTHAKRLAEKYGIRTFEKDELVAEAQKALQKQKDLEEGKKPQPLKKGQVEEPVNEEFIAEARRLAEDSGPRTIVELFRQKLRSVYGDGPVETPKNQGILLLGWPKTSEEAELLERGLMGYLPQHELPEQQAAIKKREAEIVAKPREKPPPPPVKVASFFDIVVWLDVKLPTLIRRAVDRRVDAKGNIYNLTYNPPPDNLLAKVKPIDDSAHSEEQLSLKFQTFSEHSEELYSWLSQLGSQHWDSLLFFDADLPLEQVSEIIDQKIEQYQEVRSAEQDSIHISNTSFRDQVVQFDSAVGAQLWTQWDEGLHAYLADVQSTIGAIHTNKEKVSSNIDRMLLDFVSLLQVDGNKQDILDNFIEHLASRLTGPLTSQQVARLVSEVERLSDQIWDQIETGKAEAFERRTEMIETANVDDAKFYRLRIAQHLLRIESRYFVHILNFLVEFENARTGEDSLSQFAAPLFKLDNTLAVSVGTRSPMLEEIAREARAFAGQARQECFAEAVYNYL